jgi:ribosome-associated protein
LPQEVRERLLHLNRNRVNSKGVLVIEARRYRTQESNRQDAIDRLVQLIRKATERLKKRTRTKPTAASVHRRLEQKKRIADTKKTRRPIPSSGE